MNKNKAKDANQKYFKVCGICFTNDSIPQALEK